MLVSPKAVTFIAILVAIVWAISMLADAAMQTFEASPGVQAVMMLVSGALFGSNLIPRRKSDEAPKQEAADDRPPI